MTHLTHSENWTRWIGNDAEWDRQLLDFPNYCVYQTTAWGKHRTDFGWTVHRLVKDCADACRTQILVKQSVFNTAIAWLPGGPMGAVNQLDQSFDREVLAITGWRRLYVRLNALEEYSPDSGSALVSLGWKKAKHPLSTGISLTYSLDLPESERRDLLTSNWNRNLRRGQSRNSPAYVWTDSNSTEVVKIYEEMASYKDLVAGTDVPSPENIASLMRHLQGYLLVVRCDDDNGNPLAIRGALLFGSKAWDIFAAVTPQGRKQYSSYVTAWTLFQSCADSGITSYDLSGVDPIRNKGVYDFKHGTGAEGIVYLGEWDRGAPFFMQPLVGRLMRYRRSL